MATASDDMPSRLIVFPDADPGHADLLVGERLLRIEALGRFRVHYGAPATKDEWIERTRDADAIILGWSLPNAALESATRLRVISFTGIGVGDNVDLDLARARGITVTNTPGYADNTVAEHAIALLLDLARNVTRLDRDTRAGGWTKAWRGVELRGRTLGIVGFGGIAARTAEIARALGMRVLVWTRRPDPERAARHGVAFVPLDEVLAESDVISVHVALSRETVGLIGAAELAATRPGVLLVNTARGEIIDETALIAALMSGHVAGAGLDVFAEEPLPGDHPFRRLDTVVITPHTAYNTPEATAAITDIAIANLEAFFAGDPRNVVV